MVAVPARTPVTRPVALTEAMLEADVLHVPPVTVLVNATLTPVQSEEEPETVPAFGAGLTVIVAVAVAVPQPVVTV